MHLIKTTFSVHELGNRYLLCSYHHTDIYGYIFAEGQRCQKRRPAIANPSSSNLLFLSINEVSFKNRQTNVTFNTDINDVSLEMVKIKLRQTRSRDIFRWFLDHIDGETSWRDSSRLHQQRKANFSSFHLDTSLEGLGGGPRFITRSLTLKKKKAINDLSTFESLGRRQRQLLMFKQNKYRDVFVDTEHLLEERTNPILFHLKRTRTHEMKNTLSSSCDQHSTLEFMRAQSLTTINLYIPNHVNSRTTFVYEHEENHVYFRLQTRHHTWFPIS